MTESEFKALERKYEVHIPYSNGYENGYADAEAKWLSVIEKITETMEVEYASADELADWFSDGDKTEASFYRGKASGIEWVKGIIDQAIKECDTDE